MSKKARKKIKRIFLSKHESCIISITVRGLPGEIQKGSDLCHLFYTARKGGNHAETQKIYWEQTVLPDGTWRCDADYDSERYHQLCQSSRQHHGRTGRYRADVRRCNCQPASFLSITFAFSEGYPVQEFSLRSISDRATTRVCETPSASSSGSA